MIDNGTFFIYDFKGRQYKITAVADTEGVPVLKCRSYRSIGNDEYEEQHSAEFELTDLDDVNLDNSTEIHTYLSGLFHSTEFYDIYTQEEMDESMFDDDYADTPSAGIRYFEDRGKRILNEYHQINFESMTKDEIIEAYRYITEEAMDFITDFVYSE